MNDYGKLLKGKISKLSGPADAGNEWTRATAIPDLAPETVTPPLVIPKALRGSRGRLQAETEIIFVLFNDLTGLIVNRADGEFWE